MISPSFAFWGLWRNLTEPSQAGTTSRKDYPINSLPSDVLALIFQCCDVKDKLALSLTCRRFKQVLTTHPYFKDLDFSAQNVRATRNFQKLLLNDTPTVDAIQKKEMGEIVSCYIPKTGQVVTAPINYKAIGKIYSFNGMDIPISPVCIRQIHFDSENDRLLFCGRHKNMALLSLKTGKVYGNITTSEEVCLVKMTKEQTYFTVGKALFLLKDQKAEAVHTFATFPTDLFFTKKGEWIAQMYDKLLLQNGVIIPLKFGSQVRQVVSKDWLVVADPEELRIFHATTGREVAQHSITSLLPYAAETVIGLGKCEKTDRILVSFEYEDARLWNRCHVVIWDPNQRQILSSFAPATGILDQHFDVRQLESLPELNYIVTRSSYHIQVWNLEGRLQKQFTLGEHEHIQHFHVNLERQELVALLHHSRQQIARRLSWKT